MRRFFARIGNLFRGDRADAEFEREVAAHRALLEDEYRRRGLSPPDAALAARRAIGSIPLVRDRQRDARSFPWIEDLRHDVRHAWRSLLKTPGFTCVAVLALALGIGANTSIFSVVNTVLLRPLAYRDPDRVVRLYANLPASATASRTPSRVQGTLTAVEIADVRARTRTLTAVGAFGFDLVNVSGRSSGPPLVVMSASQSIFAMLGVQAALGRTLDARDQGPAAERAIVLSDRAWRREFGSDAMIVGTAVAFENALGPRRRDLYRIVGVMPAGFEFPDTETRGWVAVRDAPAENRIRRPIMARLRPGVTPQVASLEISTILRDLRHGDRGIEQTTFEFVPQRDTQIAEVRPALLVLTGAVGLLLLIACINVANLLLARSAGRQRELAVRAAIGAGRGRLIRQGLTESLVLALLGAACGVLFALGSLASLQILATTLARVDVRGGAIIPRLDQVGLDMRVVAFTLVMSVVAGLALGLAPAWHWSRPPVSALMASDRVVGAGIGRRRTGQAFVVAEIALAMVLLLGAGLLLRGFIRLATVEPGFASSDLLTFQVALPLDRYRDDAQQRAFAEQLVERLTAHSGVQAAYARQLPMIGLQDTFQIRRTPDPADGRGSDVRFVSRDYIGVMGIPLVRGTGFSRDGTGGTRELLINEALAARDFSGEDPIGQRLYVGRDPMPWRIVGVVGNVRQFGLDRDAGPQFFANIGDWRENMLPLFPLGPYYALRAPGASESLVSLVRERLRELDAGATLFNVAPMDRIVAETISRPRTYAVLIAVFALIGLALAITGIYGVMAYAVARRTREIGVRVALGASRHSVIMLVLRQAVVLTAAGIVIGLLGGMALTRYLEGMLFGLTPSDPLTFAAMSVMFAAIAALAALVPAWRALRISPLMALRAE